MEFDNTVANYIRRIAAQKTSHEGGGVPGDPMFDQFVSIARLLIQREDFPRHIRTSACTPMTEAEVAHLLFGAPEYTQPVSYFED